MAYAEDTKVPVERSLSEIVSMVKKAGAHSVAQMEDQNRFAVQCFLKERLLRFAVTIPSLDTVPQYNGRNQRLTEAQRRDRRDQMARQRARALQLVIKAKLESVESQVETFDEAFLANVVMPNGQTVAEQALPRISDAYLTGVQRPLLLGFDGSQGTGE